MCTKGTSVVLEEKGFILNHDKPELKPFTHIASEF